MWKFQTTMDDLTKLWCISIYVNYGKSTLYDACYTAKDDRQLVILIFKLYKCAEELFINNDLQFNKHLGNIMSYLVDGFVGFIKKNDNITEHYNANNISEYST